MSQAVACPSCGTDIAAGFLACPSCQRLVHANRLKELSALAAEARQHNEPDREIAHWQDALRLLPPTSRQHQSILERVEELAKEPRPGSPAAPRTGSWFRRSWAALVAVLILVVTKGKFLLGGLTKLPTLFTMFAAFGAYWAIWGWKFALGIILTTYVHEMGHVAALVRYGIKASAPMFVPGLGAYVRLHHHPPTPEQDARVGLAGPLWGLGAGLVCYAVGTGLDIPIWLAIAKITAIINIFNLVPIWQLDGGRAFASMGRTDRWLAVSSLLIAWYVGNEGIILIVAAVAAWRAFERREQRSDPGATALFAGIAIALGWLASVPVNLASQ